MSVFLVWLDIRSCFQWGSDVSFLFSFVAVERVVCNESSHWFRFFSLSQGTIF